MRRIVIKPNELKISNGDDVITALALGSSLGICMYDGESGIGGMVYTILPKGKSNNTEGSSDLRYVDTAVETLYKRLLEAGATPGHIWAKLVGGAKLFSFMSDGPEPDIGRENVERARRKLQELDLPVLAEDTGENYGRTVYFHLTDGSIDIETVNRLRYSI